MNKISYNTAKQRIEIYKELINRIDQGKIFYMCIEIDEMLNLYRVPSDTIALFPELKSLMPTNLYSIAGWYYFNSNGMQQRKRNLLEAIKIAEKSI